MDKTLFTFLSVILFTLSSCSGDAQARVDKLMTETTPEERAEFQTARMEKMLAFDDKQRDEIALINLSYALRIQAVYDSRQPKMQRWRQIKSLTKDKDAELKKVLTPVQYSTYRENRQEIQDAMRARAKER